MEYSTLRDSDFIDAPEPAVGGFEGGVSDADFVEAPPVEPVSDADFVEPPLGEPESREVVETDFVSQDGVQDSDFVEAPGDELIVEKSGLTPEEIEIRNNPYVREVLSRRAAARVFGGLPTDQDAYNAELINQRIKRGLPQEGMELDLDPGGRQLDFDDGAWGVWQNVRDQFVAGGTQAVNAAVGLVDPDTAIERSKFLSDVFAPRTDLQESFLATKVPSFAGSAVPVIGATVASKGMAAPAMIGAVVGGGAGRMDARQHGASARDEALATAGNALLGTLEGVIFRGAGPAGKIAQGGIGTTAKRMLRSGVEEAIMETLQQGGSNAIASVLYDTSRRLDEGIDAESMAAAGVVGAAIPGMIDTMNALSNRMRTIADSGMENPGEIADQILDAVDGDAETVTDADFVPQTPESESQPAQSPVEGTQEGVGPDLSQTVEQIEADVKSELMAEVRKKGGIEIKREDGTTEATITPSTRKGVKAQLTFFGPDGKPSGHSDHNSIQDAVDTLFREHYGTIFASRRPDIPDTLGFMDSPPLFVYQPKLRPPSPGSVPKEGMVKTGKGGKWGEVFYNRPLSQKELSDFELTPVRFEESTTTPQKPTQAPQTPPKPQTPKATPKPEKARTGDSTASQKKPALTDPTTGQKGKKKTTVRSDEKNKASVDSEPPKVITDPQFKKEHAQIVREVVLGRDNVNSEQRFTEQKGYEAAQRDGNDNEAVALANAAKVVNDGEGLNESQMYGINKVLATKIADIEVIRKTLDSEAKKNLKDPVRRKNLEDELARALDQADVLSEAGIRARSSASRLLNSAKSRLNDQIDYTTITLRMKRAKMGAELTAKEKARADKLAKQAKKNSEKAKKAESKHKEARAKEAHAKARKRKTKDPAKRVSEMVDRLKSLNDAGC